MSMNLFHGTDSDVLMAIRVANGGNGVTYAELYGLLRAQTTSYLSLDKPLQRLRKTGQIRYAGKKVGWVVVVGAVC